jgi:hypothetical protein
MEAWCIWFLKPWLVLVWARDAESGIEVGKHSFRRERVVDLQCHRGSRGNDDHTSAQVSRFVRGYIRGANDGTEDWRGNLRDLGTRRGKIKCVHLRNRTPVVLPT